MTDPRYILEITDQYRQYGPWGIRVPSGGTIYFNTKEEAEKYMEEHSWSEPIPDKSTPWAPLSLAPLSGYMTRLNADGYRETEHSSKIIPPTSAPWREGGYAATKYAGAAYNALMEEETKESLVRMVLDGFDELRQLRAALAATQPKP